MVLTPKYRRDRTILQSDPVSDVLSLLDLSGVHCTRLEAGDDWGLSFPALNRLKFVAVTKGDCWLLLPDTPARRLSSGDTCMLGRTAYAVASAPAAKLVDGMALFDDSPSGIVRLGEPRTVMVGGSLVFGDDAELLLATLPKFMPIPASHAASAVLRSTIATLDEELKGSGIARSLMIARLIDVLMVQALRAYIEQHGFGSAGWVGAIADRRIGAALTAMHRDVSRSWTVAMLAEAAGMSRSSFAQRFNRLVGKSPLDYLRGWRMALARHALRREQVRVGILAARLGYSSESAFGHAYKRAFGLSPRQERRAPARHP